MAREEMAALADQRLDATTKQTICDNEAMAGGCAGRGGAGVERGWEVAIIPGGGLESCCDNRCHMGAGIAKHDMLLIAGTLHPSLPLPLQASCSTRGAMCRAC